MENITAVGFKPPYLSFQTFWSFLGQLGEKPLPPAIDRSLMDTKSGSDQIHLFNALRGFGFINDDNEVLTPLRTFVAADEEERKRILGGLVLALYPEQMQISDNNGTEAALISSFTEVFDLTGSDTRRKAITFFLHAARKAELTLSPHFPATRSGSGGPSVSRPRKRSAAGRGSNKGGHGAGGNEAGGAVDHRDKPVTGAGEIRVVNLGHAGSVTVNVNVKWLELSFDTMTKLRTLVDDLTKLAEAADVQVVVANEPEVE